jgi:hypothetical protein
MTVIDHSGTDHSGSENEQSNASSSCTSLVFCDTAFLYVDEHFTMVIDRGEEMNPSREILNFLGKVLREAGGDKE